MLPAVENEAGYEPDETVLVSLEMLEAGVKALDAYDARHHSAYEGAATILEEMLLAARKSAQRGRCASLTRKYTVDFDSAALLCLPLWRTKGLFDYGFCITANRIQGCKENEGISCGTAEPERGAHTLNAGPPS
jgi:hypothetical protein